MDINNKNANNDVFSSLNEFYHLKNTYETNYRKKYVEKVLPSSHVSKQLLRKAKLEYSKLPKPQCINCNRNVGTLFSIQKNGENLTKVYTAKCGDLNEPCPLNIKIILSERTTFESVLSNGQQIIDNIKMQIIKEKNNALFFEKNVVDEFHNLTEQLKEEMEMQGILFEMNILKNDNPEKRKILKEKQDILMKEYVAPYKQLVQRYSETREPALLERAMEIYVENIIPELKIIQKLKYDSTIVNSLNNGSIQLEQQPTSLENKEFSYNDKDDKIVSFIVGQITKKNKTAKSKDMKVKDIVVKKNKTIKLK